MNRKAKFLFKRGSKENLDTAKLSIGEPAFCEDSNELYIGTSVGPIKIGYEDAALSVNGIMHEKGNILLSASDIGAYSRSEIDIALNNKANRYNTQLTGTATLNNEEIVTKTVTDLLNANVNAINIRIDDIQQMNTEDKEIISADGSSVILENVAAGESIISGEIVGRTFLNKPTQVILGINSQNYSVLGSTGISDPDINYLTTTINDEILWFKKCVLPNGAIATTNYATTGTITCDVNPYFSCVSLSKMLENCINVPGLKDIVENYINWHLNNLTTITDLDGAISDWEYTLTNGVITSSTCKDYFDSVNTYSAYFLILVDRYLTAYPASLDFILSRFDNINRVSNSLLSVFIETGLTISKPGNAFKHLIDNTQIYDGIKSAKRIYELFESNLIDPDKIQIASTICDRYTTEEHDFLNKFEEIFWNNSANHYYVSLSDQNISSSVFKWDEFYASAISQMSTIMYDICQPKSQRAISLYTFFCQNWDWKNFGHKTSNATNNFWTMCGPLAIKMGLYSDAYYFVKKYKELYSSRPYPYFIHECGWVLQACQQLINHFQTLATKPIELPTQNDIFRINEDGSGTWIQATQMNATGTNIETLPIPITHTIPKTSMPKLLITSPYVLIKCGGNTEPSLFCFIVKMKVIKEEQATFEQRLYLLETQVKTLKEENDLLKRQVVYFNTN